jgi:hypothetical protein
MRIAAAVLFLFCLQVSAFASDVTGTKELSLQVGRHAYLNDFEKKVDPGTALLYVVSVGHNISNKSMLSLRVGGAEYEIARAGGTKKKSNLLTEIAVNYRYSFRSAKSLRIYLEAGAGFTEPILGFDRGNMKFLGSWGWGLKRYIGEKYAISLNMKNAYWRQDDTFQNSGDTTGTLLNEISAGISFKL